MIHGVRSHGSGKEDAEELYTLLWYKKNQGDDDGDQQPECHTVPPKYSLSVT